MDHTLDSPQPVHTRRGLLRRLALFAGGAIGVAYGAAPASARRAPDPGPPPGRAPRRFVLHGRDWRLSARGASPGRLPPAGEPLVPHGRLVDARGRTAGRFGAAPLPGPAAIFQFHTFELEGGSVLGVGGGSLRESVFAVVGGTGAFAGVSGSYVARQFPREAGGDGTAEFTFTLTVPEV